MKRCPKCNESWKEEYKGEFQICPICGGNLESDKEASNISIGDSNAISGGVHLTDNHSNINTGNANAISGNSSDGHSTISIGDANAVSGGIHITDDHSREEIHTNSHNTTIYEAQKSESDKLKENILTYRLKCKEFFKDGLISNEDARQLRELQFTLNLAEELVSPIKEDIRLQSKIRKKQLPTIGMTDIRQTKSIIEQNTAPALQRQLDKLEAWMREYDDNTLKLTYYQMSSILEPLRYTNRYEDSVKDEYWEVYWAYVAYLLQNREKQANEALANLGRWHARYPEQNDIMLQLVGRLMQNEPLQDVQQVRKQLTLHFTPDLQLLLDSIDELLNMDWIKESICIRPAHSFYINALFKSFVETQTAIGKQQLIEIREQEKLKREEDERKRQAELKLQNQIKCQKASVLQKFQELGQIENACFEVGVPYHTFNLWLKEDAVFASSYNDMIRSVEMKKYEEAEKKRKEEELETQTKKLKHNFKILFEQNECDLLKTCTEVGVSSANYYEWCRNDAVFNDEIAYILRKNEDLIENEKNARRKETYRKFRPVIYIAIILVIAVIGFVSYSSYNEHKAQAEITQRYEKTVREFDESFAKINNEEGFNYISKSCSVVIELRNIEKNEHFEQPKQSQNLTLKLQEKIKQVIEYNKPLTTVENKELCNSARQKISELIKLQKEIEE